MLPLPFTSHSLTRYCAKSLPAHVPGLLELAATSLSFAHAHHYMLCSTCHSTLTYPLRVLAYVLIFYETQ
jgi:hypothetical protein